MQSQFVIYRSNFPNKVNYLLYPSPITIFFSEYAHYFRITFITIPFWLLKNCFLDNVIKCFSNTPSIIPVRPIHTYFRFLSNVNKHARGNRNVTDQININQTITEIFKMLISSTLPYGLGFEQVKGIFSPHLGQDQTVISSISKREYTANSCISRPIVRIWIREISRI